MVGEVVRERAATCVEPVSQRAGTKLQYFGITGSPFDVLTASMSKTAVHFRELRCPSEEGRVCFREAIRLNFQSWLSWLRHRNRRAGRAVT